MLFQTDLFSSVGQKKKERENWLKCGQTFSCFKTKTKVHKSTKKACTIPRILKSHGSFVWETENTIDLHYSLQWAVLSASYQIFQTGSMKE